MRARWILCSATILLGVAAAAPPVLALTASEVLDKMSEDERFAYLAGNIDMAAQLAYHDGKSARSDCIFDWFYKKGGTRQVLQAIERFRDKPVQPVIFVLINKTCGE